MELANILEVSVKEDKENRLPLRNHINFSRYYFYLKEIFGNDEMLIGDIFHYLKHQILFIIFLDWVSTVFPPATTDDFELLKVIGRGQLGKVLLCRCKKTRKLYSMKVINQKQYCSEIDKRTRLLKRYRLYQANSPFLCQHYLSFEGMKPKETSSDSTFKLYLLSEFVSGGELFFHLSKERRFTEPRAKFYVAQLILGLDYIHKMGLVYEHLKPEEILLNDQGSSHFVGHIQLTDFVSFKSYHAQPDSRSYTCYSYGFVGAPEYLAPEILQGHEYSIASDFWCLGTMIYELLTGLPPFYCEDQQQMYHKIMSDDVVFPHYISSEAQDLISKFLNRKPEKRLTDQEEMRNHPWFSTINWKDLAEFKVEAPFIPVSHSNEPSCYISCEFLPVEDDERIDVNIADAFAGFTYVGGT